VRGWATVSLAVVCFDGTVTYARLVLHPLPIAARPTGPCGAVRPAMTDAPVSLDQQTRLGAIAAVASNATCRVARGVPVFDGGPPSGTRRSTAR
jgi:hypothetical protein